MPNPMGNPVGHRMGYVMRIARFFFSLAPQQGVWCHGHQPCRTQNCLSYPGQPWLWVPMASEGAGAGSGNVVVAFAQGMHRGIKSPKCWVVLACGTASSRPLEGYSEGVLLTERAGAKALELLWVLHSAWGRRPTGRGAERPVLGVASWSPVWHCCMGPCM